MDRILAIIPETGYTIFRGIIAQNGSTNDDYRGSNEMRPIILGGTTAILQKVIFEIRYRHGFRYLDVCGSIINTLQKESSEWIHARETNPQGGSLVSLMNGCILNFSSLKIDLTLERPTGEGPLNDEDFEGFLRQVDIAPEIVIDRLSVTDISRMGFRAFYLFPKNDMKASENWLLSLNVYSFSDSLIRAFGGDVEATSALIVLFGNSAKYRISFSGVERQAQIDFGQVLLNVQSRNLSQNQREHLKKQIEVKRRMRQNPEFAVQLDIDCSLDDPKEIKAARFIQECIEEYSSKLESGLAKKG